MAEKEIKLKVNEVLKSKNGFRRYEYNPNFIHDKGMREVEVVDDSILQYTEPSVTDKESYRVTLSLISFSAINYLTNKKDPYLME